ncbi:MAG: hypothetical protein IH608_02175, partial [Proteobacteria bacterium]|nr:hypothetical protein [Pseudomonadota bacterium]
MRRLSTLVAVAAVGALVAGAAVAQQMPANPNLVTKFVNQLPVLKLDPSPLVPGIPVALGNTVADPLMPKQLRQDVTVNMCEFSNDVLPLGAAPGPSHVWGYRLGACPGQDVLQTDSYIGPVVVAQRGVPTRLTYVNQLGDSGSTAVLAYANSTDLTLMWADPLNTGGTDAELLTALNAPVIPQPTAPLQTPWVDAIQPELNYCTTYAAANPDAPPLAICAGNYVGPIPAAPHLHGGEI